jgi:hypothetical protein
MADAGVAPDGAENQDDDLVKGAPAARQANRPKPRLARMRGTCTESVNELGE